MALHFEKLSTSRLNALPRDRTVFFFATGGMSDHGPHLPLGLEVLQSSRQVELCADRLENELPGWVAVIMPTMSLNIESRTPAVAVTVRAHVLRDWLVDSCLGLTKLGFKHFVCFSGSKSPKQLTAIEEAGKLVRRKSTGGWLGMLMKKRMQLPSLVSASSALISPAETRASLFWFDPAENGGKQDTSIALALSPIHVDPNYRTLPRIDREANRWKRAWIRTRQSPSGYWGAPAEASPELGHQLLKAGIDDVFPKLRAVWEGANPEALFRSWYSIIPMNKSFFKTWILLFWVFLLMIAWVYFSLGGL